MAALDALGASGLDDTMSAILGGPMILVSGAYPIINDQ